MTVAIMQIHELPFERLHHLLRESEMSGFSAMQRLIDDWHTATNRFDKRGEALFIASDGCRIIGICGLNCDPYTAEASIGRVRHLYVMICKRRQRVGTQLVNTIVKIAKSSFSCLRLRTDNTLADSFYRSLGFDIITDDPFCTHQLEFDAAT